jgi:hypothetical protein
MGPAVTWQDAGVILIVGAAVAYVVRKFVFPPKPRAAAATFITVQQVKARSRATPDSR